MGRPLLDENKRKAKQIYGRVKEEEYEAIDKARQTCKNEKGDPITLSRFVAEAVLEMADAINQGYPPEHKPKFCHKEICPDCNRQTKKSP